MHSHLGAIALSRNEHDYSCADCPIFLEGLRCVGTESTLLECKPLQPLGLATCDHMSVAAVHCEGVYIYKWGKLE